ncbi:hypothetical protein BH11PSE4_BH11PSE4_21890 [soil metagenome]
MTPHPSALRAATLSHKGRGKKGRYVRTSSVTPCQSSASEITNSMA